MKRTYCLKKEFVNVLNPVTEREIWHSGCAGRRLAVPLLGTTFEGTTAPGFSLGIDVPQNWCLVKALQKTDALLRMGRIVVFEVVNAPELAVMEAGHAVVKAD